MDSRSIRNLISCVDDAAARGRSLFLLDVAMRYIETADRGSSEHSDDASDAALVAIWRAMAVMARLSATFGTEPEPDEPRLVRKRALARRLEARSEATLARLAARVAMREDPGDVE